jgi:DNA (cytosine-5)-methyltransferase 1
MKILDLFCGGGGAAEGYMRAFPGCEIVGVDIADHEDNYPGDFVCGDALDLLEKFGPSFDFIHASPPCQGYSPHVSSASSEWVPTLGRDEPRLIGAVRDLLLQVGKPYAIENVMGARNEMRSPTLLCGSMFGLDIARHRLFETSFPVDLLPHPVCLGIAKEAAARRGWEYRDMSVTGKGRRAGTGARWSELLGVTHPMTQSELSEAIPPAYTHWIGWQSTRVRAASMRAPFEA